MIHWSRNDQNVMDEPEFIDNEKLFDPDFDCKE